MVNELGVGWGEAALSWLDEKRVPGMLFGMNAQRDDIITYFDQAPGGSSWRFADAEQRVLEQINQKVAAGRSLDEVVEFVFSSTAAVLPCDRISLAFLDDDGERLTSHVVKTLYDPIYLQKGFWQGIRGSSLESVIRGGQLRVINDLEAYLAEHPGSVSTKLLVKEGVRSSMTCPLRVDERIVGVLFRSSRRPFAYGEREARLHHAMAERLSQAVEKAWMIERLAAANRAYTEMLGFVAHELKGPLAGLIMEGHLLIAGYLGRLKPQQEERVRRMIQRAEYLTGLVRDYLDLAAVEGGDLKLRVQPGVDVMEAIVKPAVDSTAGVLQESNMNLKIEQPTSTVTADCDPEMLKIVLVNLLSNAAKYGKASGEIRVKVESREGRVFFSVWNEGIGFREADQTRLFKRFSRLATPEFARIRGTGLGLYTAWRIVQLHGGRIRASSEYGKWAEFAFEIPIQGNVG